MAVDTQRKSAQSAYRRQKYSARQRGIEWQFTFDSWWAVWQASGRWEQRGRNAGSYVMSRPGDKGPYSPTNVEFIPCEQNSRDCRANHPNQDRSAAGRATLGKGRGWTFVATRRSKPYQVMLGKAYVGIFATQAEAEEAYRAAVGVHSQSFGGVR
jgi:hypothetical protein